MVARGFTAVGRAKKCNAESRGSGLAGSRRAHGTRTDRATMEMGLPRIGSGRTPAEGVGTRPLTSDAARGQRCLPEASGEHRGVGHAELRSHRHASSATALRRPNANQHDHGTAAPGARERSLRGRLQTEHARHLREVVAHLPRVLPLRSVRQGTKAECQQETDGRVLRSGSGAVHPRIRAGRTSRR